MTTPRRTRLFRAADLREYRDTIAALALEGDVFRARDRVVLVPTTAAADQLRRTLEDGRLRGASSAARAVHLPHLVTRSGWYDLMHARMKDPPRRLSQIEREVLTGAAAREAAHDVEPPFHLRPGLLVEMLTLYDELRRRGSTVDSFERLVGQELERDVETDRGAERLLRQTRFLALAFRRYEERRDQTGGVDEYTLRTRLIQSPPSRPIRHVIVTVGERAVDSAGLWPADFDVLTRLPLLEAVDIVATRESIAAGLLDRLQKFVPGFEESEAVSPAAGAGERMPVLVTPSPDLPYALCRDREDELSSIVRGIAASGSTGLDERAVVFRKPLPYVYLGSRLFADAGVPVQTFDALPLAAEPYAAALDVLCEFVTSNFTRDAIVALLSSPHFAFQAGHRPVERGDIALLNRRLSESGYIGGLEKLRPLAEGGLRAARAALDAALELQPLREESPRSAHLDVILRFLSSHERPMGQDDPLRERHLRARRAIVAALEGLRQAHAAFDDSPSDFVGLSATIRRWIEGQTFSPRRGDTGVQLVDADAARYGKFDEIFLVGLVEGEWPARSSKSIFYPAWLLAQLDWPDSRVAMAGERAAFHDLLRLPARRVHVSAFELEHDALVGPSVFLDDLRRAGLTVREGVASPDVARLIAPAAASWLALRQAREDAAAARYHGTAGPYRPESHSVSALERYLQCPFRFFAERVLGLPEDPEDDTTLNPRQTGIFVHEVFQRFFHEWGSRGNGAITPENLPEARTLFGEVAEPLIDRLSPSDAAVQRARLLGTAVDPGLAEAVFQAEAEWDMPVVRRLLEYPVEGEFDIQTDGGVRRVPLRGKVDRIDLLADRTFRVIDYKLSRAPERRHALQLPIYTLCAMQQLRRETGQSWEPGQAGYIAFGQDRQFVPMLARGTDIDTALGEAQARMTHALDRIDRGEFPAAPADPIMCTRCPYTAVCRKDYVGAL